MNSGNNCQGALVPSAPDSPVPGQGTIRPSSLFGGACVGAFLYQFGLQSATSATFNSLFATFPQLPPQALVSPMPVVAGRARPALHRRRRALLSLLTGLAGFMKMGREKALSCLVQPSPSYSPV